MTLQHTHWEQAWEAAADTRVSESRITSFCLFAQVSLSSKEHSFFFNLRELVLYNHDPSSPLKHAPPVTTQMSRYRAASSLASHEFAGMELHPNPLTLGVQPFPLWFRVL